MAGREDDPLALLDEGAAALGLTLPPAARERFRVYLAELSTWNARVNLTGLRTPRDLVIKGFLDSLAVLPFLGEAASLADVGSGAGFPGLVLKLARPHLALTLVEARGKKAAFLHYLVSLWQLSDVDLQQVHLTPASARRWGRTFQAVISRAVFPLRAFLEVAAPLLRPGGLALALKGPRLPPGELQTARECLPRLNLNRLEVRDYPLPLLNELRLVVMASKQP